MKASFIKKNKDQIMMAPQATITLKNGKEITLYPSENHKEGLECVVEEDDNVFIVVTIDNAFFIDCDDIAMITF